MEITTRIHNLFLMLTDSARGAVTGLLIVGLLGFGFPAEAQSNACDLNKDGTVNSADVTLAVDMTLGKQPCSANLNGAGVCNAVTVQRVVNAGLGQACVVDRSFRPGLIAAYSFDEGSGTTVTDLSGNGHHGTISSATWTSAGKYGRALAFNGTNALVNVPDAPALRLTTGMTLAAWVNPSTVLSSWRTVIYKGNDNYFLNAFSPSSARPAGGGIFSGTITEAYGTSALTANSWTHLALTYDGASLRLYVNGIQVRSVARSGNIATSSNPLQIGGDSRFYGQWFAGLIDEVRIYNRSLSAAEIQEDMSTPLGTGVVSALPPPPPPTPTVVLTWVASISPAVVGYNVYRATTSGGPYSRLTPSLVGTTTYTDTSVQSGHTYYYVATAVDGSQRESSYSNQASATIP